MANIMGMERNICAHCKAVIRIPSRLRDLDLGRPIMSRIGLCQQPSFL